MSNTRNKSKDKYYRLVNTNWTGEEMWKGKMIKEGTIIAVSPKDLKNAGLLGRLKTFFVELNEKEVKAHKGTVVGTEKVISEPISIIENK